MDIRDRKTTNMILTAANFNRTYRQIYREFQEHIFLKIANKEPEREDWIDYALSGCVTKPSYFLNAVYYMQVELTEEHKIDLRDTLFSQLYPVITLCTQEMLELLLRSILEALSKKILQMDVITFEDLKNIDYRDLLLSSGHFMQQQDEQKKLLISILDTLPFARLNQQNEYGHYVDTLINTRSQLWKGGRYSEREYQREIENEFILSEVKLK